MILGCPDITPRYYFAVKFPKASEIEIPQKSKSAQAMPAKKSVQSPPTVTEQAAEVTSAEALIAFQDIAKEMEMHRSTSEDGGVAAWNIPVDLMKAAAMATSDGQQHALMVRGLTTSNVANMKNTLGHSGSLSSANFLVREEMLSATKDGVYT